MIGGKDKWTAKQDSFRTNISHSRSSKGSNSFLTTSFLTPFPSIHRDEDREKSSDHLKSSSSEESVRKRRPSGNISLNSQLSICTQNSNTLSNITYGSDYTASTVSASIPAPVLPKSISQASTPHHVQSADTIPEHKEKNGLKETDFPQYENTESLKKHSGYVYHDEPHSFENTIEFMEDSNHFTYEVLETTVWT